MPRRLLALLLAVLVPAGQVQPSNAGLGMGPASLGDAVGPPDYYDDLAGGSPAGDRGVRNADGKVNGLNLTEGGQDRHASRLEGEVAKAWAPSARDLAAFEGRLSLRGLRIALNLARH